MADEMRAMILDPHHDPLLDDVRIPTKQWEPADLILSWAHRAGGIEPENAARLQHAMDLGQALLEVGHVLHHTRGDDDVEVVVGEWNILGDTAADVERDTETRRELASDLPCFVPRLKSVRVAS
jgi:hypothetical protein